MCFIMSDPEGNKMGYCFCILCETNLVVHLSRTNAARLGYTNKIWGELRNSCWQKVTVINFSYNDRIRHVGRYNLITIQKLKYVELSSKSHHGNSCIFHRNTGTFFLVRFDFILFIRLVMQLIRDQRSRIYLELYRAA